jgi:hypothetical protein
LGPARSPAGMHGVNMASSGSGRVSSRSAGRFLRARPQRLKKRLLVSASRSRHLEAAFHSPIPAPSSRTAPAQGQRSRPTSSTTSPIRCSVRSDPRSAPRGLLTRGEPPRANPVSGDSHRRFRLHANPRSPLGTFVPARSTRWIAPLPSGLPHEPPDFPSFPGCRIFCAAQPDHHFESATFR